MNIKNETEWLNEDIERLLPKYTTLITVDTIRTPGRSADRMSLWEWSRNSANVVRLCLMSRQRLEASISPLERLADPEWVSMSKDVVYSLVQSISGSGTYGRLRVYEKPVVAPTDFALTLRMPTKRKTAAARVFSVAEVEGDLTTARNRLLYQEGWWTRKLAEVAAERAESLAQSEKRIAMLEKRLEKAKRGARKPA